MNVVRRMLPLALAGALAASLAAQGVDRLAGAPSAAPDAGASAADSSVIGEELPGRYIVVLREGEDSSLRARLYGAAFPAARVDHVFGDALEGFAGRLPQVAVEELKDDPSVVAVELDRVVGVSDEALPTGIDRIDAEPGSDLNGIGGEVDIDVAVLDTGVGPNSDLFVEGGFASYAATFPTGVVCGNSGSWNDGHGHGTHVAGTIAARDNDSGVVGVAPGARIWSVRVLGSTGAGCLSDVIAGVDWVTRHADTVEVANMSLAGGSSPALCAAIENSIAAGVTYVVAAGNYAADALELSPPNCPGVIVVSAFADFDGTGGALANQAVAHVGCTEAGDDSIACFSNYGAAVDIAAPGVLILSSVPDDALRVMSGTSMAAPHVAGAAALYLSLDPAASPAAVRSALIAAGECPGGEPVGADEVCDRPWPDDPDTQYEPLLRVRGAPWLSDRAFGPTRTPTGTPTITATPTITPTPTLTATPAPDTDGDLLPDVLEEVYGTDPANPDTDGDSCADGAEVGSDPTRGGRRDPLNPWDFYDINRDGHITAANDVLPVIMRYQMRAGDARYDPIYDRGRSTGPYPWNMTAPDGTIDAITDLLGILLQFQHDCRRR